MPAIQTTYNATMRPAVAGVQADMTPSTMISRTVESEAGVGFGVAVAQGTADYGCIPFAGADFLGITVRERSVRAGTNAFAQYDSVRIMTKGTIWVTTAVAVAAGDPVYVTDAGAFTNVATDNTAIPNARFDTSTAGAGLAVVRLG